MDFRQFVHNITLGIALFSMLVLPLSALGFINYNPGSDSSQVLSAESDASTREFLPKYIIVRESTETTQTSSSEAR